MKEAFFTERGIYYRVSEMRVNLRTILFVHGLSGSSSVWFPYEREFEDTYNIVSLDLRGHGKSTKRSSYEEYSPEHIAEDMTALLSHLNIDSCAIIAHSFGTRTALSFMRAHSERVSAAVFLSPVYGVTSAWWMPVARFVCIVISLFGRIFLVPSAPRGHVDYQRLYPTGDWSLRRIIPDVRNTTLRVYTYCLRHLYTEHSDAYWEDIRMPTIIVHGKKDTIVGYKNAEALARIVPHTRLILIPHANHILPVNAVPEIIEILRGFLRTL